MDQYQITSHFSQKVFLGGIPAELTEGKQKKREEIETCNTFISSGIIVGLTKIRQMQYQMAKKWWSESEYAR